MLGFRQQMRAGGGIHRINRDHVTGFVVGVGVVAAGYYAYIKNKDSIDQFLASHGIHIPKSESEDLKELTLEELVLKKEAIEDLIAEKEMEVKMETVITSQE